MVTYKYVEEFKQRGVNIENLISYRDYSPALLSMSISEEERKLAYASPLTAQLKGTTTTKKIFIKHLIQQS